MKPLFWDKISFNYLMGGLLFGLAFPIVGTFLQLQTSHLEITFENVLYIHRNFPLIWIIDLAPLVLISYSFFLARLSHKAIKSEEGERFRLLFDKSPEAHIMFDGQQIVDCNEANLTLFGYSGKSQIIGLHPRQLSPETQSDGSSSAIKADQMLALAFELGHNSFEWDHVKADGTVFPVEVTLTPVRFHGKSIIIAALHDLTDRKQKESEIREFEKFFKLSLDLLCIAGNDGFFKKVNPRFMETLGYTREELLGKPFLEFVHVDDIPATLKEMEALASGKPTITFTNRYRKADGNYLFINWTTAPDPETGLLFAAARDITDRIDAYQKLEEINKELDKFAYVVSHDLKAPLRAISSLATWIEEDNLEKLNPESLSNFKLLKGRVNRMENLINGILTYSRIGRGNSAKGSVDLNDLLGEIRSDLQLPEGFVIQIQENLPTLNGNPVLLRQIFQNLISNAIQYGDKPDGKIEVACKSSGKFWEFCVQDNGPGIPAEYHEKVFEMFQTLESRDVVESTGIGLALVKKIVEENGGNVRIESKTGNGTSMFFNWPK